MGRTPHALGGCPILVAESVAEYRAAVALHVSSDDTALEVGCAEGVTTALLARHARQAFGVDQSASQVVKARARHARRHNLAFAQLDAWDLSAVQRHAAAAGCAGFSVVLIDVSGNRRVGDVESLLMKYDRMFRPRLLIAKSYALTRLVNRCSLVCAAEPAQQLDERLDERRQQPLQPAADGAGQATAAGRRCDVPART